MSDCKHDNHIFSEEAKDAWYIQIVCEKCKEPLDINDLGDYMIVRKTEISELKESLRWATKEASGWYDDCRGQTLECEEMERAKALLIVRRPKEVGYIANQPEQIYILGESTTESENGEAFERRSLPKVLRPHKQGKVTPAMAKAAVKKVLYAKNSSKAEKTKRGSALSQRRMRNEYEE